MKVGHRILTALLCLCVATSAAMAQSSDDVRVRRLEDTIRNLELRVSALESQQRETSTPTSAPAANTNWHRLKTGMSEVEVVKLLGDPSKVNTRESYFNWLYGSPASGFVQFDSKSRKVKSWSAP
jgi:hypothetical protein